MFSIYEIFPKSDICKIGARYGSIRQENTGGNYRKMGALATLELAEKIHLSPPQTLRRVRNLEKTRYYSGLRSKSRS